MTAIRPSLTAEEAAVVQAALLYWRDTYINDPEAGDSADDEAERLRYTYLADRIRIRVHRALRRRGYPVVLDE